MISHHHYIAHCITFQRLQVPHQSDYRFSSYGGNTNPYRSSSLHFHIYLINLCHKLMLLLHYHIEHWNSFPTLRTAAKTDLRFKSYEFSKFRKTSAQTSSLSELPARIWRENAQNLLSLAR